MPFNYSPYSSILVATHNRIHTGAKPLECGKCSYTCSDSSNMAKHRKCKHYPSSHRSRWTYNQIQLMSLLCIFAQPVGSSSAEPTRGIVICVYTRRGLQDASVYMVRLLNPKDLMDSMHHDGTQLHFRSDDAWRFYEDIPLSGVILRRKRFTFLFVILYSSSPQWHIRSSTCT